MFYKLNYSYIFITYDLQMLVLQWPKQAMGNQSFLQHDTQSWIQLAQTGSNDPTHWIS
jgi:hypothetical protein